MPYSRYESSKAPQAMDNVTIPAHFDGTHIQLDRPYELKLDARLLVTVLPEQTSGPQDPEFGRIALQGLARAYGDEEPEYLPSMLRETNPAYEGG